MPAKRMREESETRITTIAKRGRPTLTDAQLALRKVRKLEQAIESKIFDNTEPAYAVDDTGVAYPISDVQAGPAFNERIGDAILPTKLELSYDVRDIAASGTGSRAIRVLVIQCRHRFIPVFDNSGNNGVLEPGNATYEYLSALQHDNKHHFTVLYDKTHTLVTGASNEIQSKKVTLYPKRKVVFEDLTATAVEMGRIYVLAISNATTTDVVMDHYSRLYFKDG